VAAEYRTGLHAFAAALAALWHAAQSEHGQVVEVTGVSALASHSVTGAHPGEVPEPIRDMVELTHPTNGTVVTQRGPFELSETPWLAGIAPELGQDTDEILGEIEVDAGAIEALRREGVI
jgi:crotonobetainyl-CoA:carnitine CoA-transferase CaiB-like acyl-CoA transferase